MSFHEIEPQDFNPKFEIVSCFCEYDGTFLLLLRQDWKPQGNTWGAPAGKKEPNESIEDAIRRELEEETGIVLGEQVLHYFGKVYARYDDYDFTYHIFQTAFSQMPNVTIQTEAHKESRWVKPEDALTLNLIQDMDSVIKFSYKI